MLMKRGDTFDDVMWATCTTAFCRSGEIARHTTQTPTNPEGRQQEIPKSHCDPPKGIKNRPGQKECESSLGQNK